MSKAFRSKQLDFHKPIAVYWCDEIFDIEPNAVIRAIPVIPSGMEKEEESEEHLREALSAQEKQGTTGEKVIPIPEIDELSAPEYGGLYSKEFKLPKHLIRIPPLSQDQEYPDYDCDVEDEQWLTENGARYELTAVQLESMIDRLEKGCSAQAILQLAEAKALLREDDEVATAVYDYWLNKRMQLKHPLLLHVRTERRDGVSINDPYVAFRRRAEKMQTRRNRKSEEMSYEKMVKLKRDIAKLLQLFEPLRLREKNKKELVQLTKEIFERRYELKDFDGEIAAAAEAQRLKDKRPAFMAAKAKTPLSAVDSLKQQQKRKLQQLQQRQHLIDIQEPPLKNRRPGVRPLSRTGSTVDGRHPSPFGSPKIASPPRLLPPEPEGRYDFKRMAGAVYHTPHPLGADLSKCSSSSFSSRLLHLSVHGPKSRFSLVSYRNGRTRAARTIASAGYTRLRRGRGGARRIILDRKMTPWSTALKAIDDWASEDAATASGLCSKAYADYICQNKIPHAVQQGDSTTGVSRPIADAVMSAGRLPQAPTKLDISSALVFPSPSFTTFAASILSSPVPAATSRSPAAAISVINLPPPQRLIVSQQTRAPP